MLNNVYTVGDKVIWKWFKGEVHGEVMEVYKVSITKKIKGKNITRNGTPERPAYLVKSEAGNLALKLHSELYGKPDTGKSSRAPYTGSLG
mgnify:FL=1